MEERKGLYRSLGRIAWGYALIYLNININALDLLPEVGVHLACGLPNVTTVEYMPWLYPLFLNPPAIETTSV